MTAHDDQHAPAPAGDPNAQPGPADGPTEVLWSKARPTQALGSSRARSGEPGPADSEYSATVLASHWIQRPATDETLVEAAAEERSTPPDRVEGTVLRFGPGVTASAAHRTQRMPAATPPSTPRLRRLRRHTLPVVVVLCVLALLAWQRLGQPLRVDGITVTARPTALGCDGTAHIVALVTTNGRPGTLSYRWVRSDGTASGVLEEGTVRGQKRARLHLRWTFQGPGQQTARAELRILSGPEHTAATRFTYTCP
ncbi:hypothetical protein BJ965_007573 [Streptomyces luteogriseus]|uniref:Ig-like domain-containing protein n=1 Tax=Streptomyces luteogriseus TaxID=68233 RepID=A0A7W7GKN0_9ACTN|nr:hypothetical protein [Streptomyces luteogriseus]MBB4717691.1 hypothetical protein [Streptomyces luteogriseus]